MIEFIEDNCGKLILVFGLAIAVLIGAIAVDAEGRQGSLEAVKTGCGSRNEM